MQSTRTGGPPAPTTVRERKLADQRAAAARAAQRRRARRPVLQRTAAAGAVGVIALGALSWSLTRDDGVVTTSGLSEGVSRSGTVRAPASPSVSAASAASTIAEAAATAEAGSPSAATSSSPRPASGRSMAVEMYGKPLSGLPWHSGFWTGGTGDTAHLKKAAAWRGTAMDFATVYPQYNTWAELGDSDWAVAAFADFNGKLSYGLPLLPKDRKGQWGDITSGAHDAVFRGIATSLVKYGHGDAAIRMGVEANGYWFPWAVDVNTTDEFKAAYRHIRTVMKSVAPDLTFWLDLNCGTVLTGSTDRLAPLTRMYPGDDVVDGISMDHYNAYKLQAIDEATWQRGIAPPWAVGLADGATFARAHGKGFAVPEWGLHDTQGPGDSPYFMQRMWDFFQANADILVYENYFNEPDPYIANALFEASNNPKSAALYRQLWGRKG